MQELLIKCNSMSKKVAVVSFLYGLGYKWSNFDTFQDYLSGSGCNYGYDAWPNIILRKRHHANNYYIDACQDEWIGAKSIEFFDLVEVPEWLKEQELNKPVEIKISEDYNAIVSKKQGIQVGCQTIKFEDFDKLVEIVAKIRN